MESSESAHSAVGKDGSKTVLLAQSCQRELGGEPRLISAVVGVWCKAQTQFKALLTLANSQAPLSVSHLSAKEERLGIIQA